VKKKVYSIIFTDFNICYITCGFINFYIEFFCCIFSVRNKYVKADEINDIEGLFSAKKQGFFKCFV